MQKYNILITVKPSKPNKYCNFDNTIPTATMINNTIREKLRATELTISNGKDSILLTKIEGTIEKTLIYYELTDYSGSYLSLLKHVVGKYQDSYDVTLEIDSIVS